MYRLNLQSVFFSGEIFHLYDFTLHQNAWEYTRNILKGVSYMKKIHESWNFSLSKNFLDQLFCSIPVKILGIVTDSWKVHTC